MTRPFVTVHFAQSLDGHLDDRVAPAPLQLSNNEGFCAAHRARAEHDAVLVGIGTVLRDNPKLLTSKIRGKHPHRVVFDSRLRTPPTAQLLSPTDGTRVYIFALEGVHDTSHLNLLRERGAEVILLPPEPQSQRLSVPLALERLSLLGVRSVLVEGGARVIQSFLRAQCVDLLQIEVVPRVVGVTGVTGLGSLFGSLEFEAVEFEPLGTHILVRGKPKYVPHLAHIGSTS